LLSGRMLLADTAYKKDANVTVESFMIGKCMYVYYYSVACE
jgi:hypothetical protein